MSEFNFKAGYPGNDSMRSRAEQLFRLEGPTNMRTRASSSALDRIPARTFSEGGYADGGALRKGGRARRRAEGGDMYSEGGETYADGGALRRGGRATHRLTREQSDMHLPRRVPASKYSDGGYADGGETYSDGGALRRGGRAHRRAEGGEMRNEGGAMRKGGRAKYGLGGSLLGGIGNLAGGILDHILPFSEGGEARAEGGALRRGGRAKRRAEGGEMYSDGGYADGGELRRGGRAHRKHREEGGALRLGGTPGRPRFEDGGEARADGGELRRGGRAYRKHRAEGGLLSMPLGMGPIGMRIPDNSFNLSRALPNGIGAYKKGGRARRRAEGGDMYSEGGETYADGGALRRGGRAHRHHHAEGGEMKRAGGGSIYEREMLGEHPSRRAPHINYEANMRGEHGHPRRYSDGGEAKCQGGEMRADGGALRRGGRAHRRAEGGGLAEGGSYAVGGVGKMRLGMATRRGMPVNHRHRRGH